MKIINILLFAILIAGCSSTKFPPAFSFSLINCPVTDGAGATTSKCKLKRHPTSSISAKEGTVLRLSVDSAYFASMYEKKPVQNGYSGKREVLLYAVIYKNGNFLKFSKITDIADNMASYEPIVVQQPLFFTETMDASYHIIIKGYEVDTKTVVRLLRRAKNTNISTIEDSFYYPGKTFASGFKEFFLGFFNMALSLTGRSVDDWAAKAYSDQVFEHSIYIVPGNEDTGSEKMVLLDSGDDKLFQGQLIKDNANKDNKDKLIANYTKNKLTEIEGKDFNLEDFKDGKDDYFNGSSYIIISAERLGTTEAPGAPGK